MTGKTHRVGFGKNNIDSQGGPGVGGIAMRGQNAPIAQGMGIEKHAHEKSRGCKEIVRPSGKATRVVKEGGGSKKAFPATGRRAKPAEGPWGK